MQSQRFDMRLVFDSHQSPSPPTIHLKCWYRIAKFKNFELCYIHNKAIIWVQLIDFGTIYCLQWINNFPFLLRKIFLVDKYLLLKLIHPNLHAHSYFVPYALHRLAVCRYLRFSCIIERTVETKGVRESAPPITKQTLIVHKRFFPMRLSISQFLLLLYATICCRKYTMLSLLSAIASAKTSFDFPFNTNTLCRSWLMSHNTCRYFIQPPRL